VMSSVVPCSKQEPKQRKKVMCTTLDIDFETVMSKEEQVKQQFKQEVAQQMNVRPEDVTILSIQRGSTLIMWVIDPLANNPAPTTTPLLYSKFDRGYHHPEGAFWAGDSSTNGRGIRTNVPLIRGGDPYWCPLGWKRFAVFVDGVGAHPNEVSHTQLPTGWAVAYHGTKATTAPDPTQPPKMLDIPQLILKNGFKLSAGGCWMPPHWGGALYTTPSIEYAGADRYAEPYVLGNQWYQLVFQLKVNKNGATLKGDHFIEAAETLRGWDYDHNWDKNKLEWLFRDTSDVKVCGMMIRKGNVADLGPNATHGKLRGRLLDLEHQHRGKMNAF